MEAAMTSPDDQIAELKLLCAGLQQGEEAGYPYFLLPGLRLPAGCDPPSMDVLLCPVSRDGYASRLFFAERLKSHPHLNWNANRVRILERNWDAFSWRVSAEPRLIQMLAAHLRALK
jgi:hypothetical protein